jgi:hypothetical protein
MAAVSDRRYDTGRDREEDWVVADQDLVTVEFYGIPRQRAGRAELAVAPGTVAELLAAVERACPGLAGLVREDGRLAPHYLLSVDGR